MSVSATLDAIAPELVSTEANRKALIISLAEKQVGQVFGELRELAVAYVAAHMLTMTNRGAVGGAAAGAIQRIKEDDLEVAYASTGDKSPYASTSYGSEFLRLRKACVLTPMISGACT